MTDRPRLAFHHSPGQGPTILFLPGYASDMQGSKALALEAWARARGLAFLRFDYAGCGQSEGAFADQTLAGWRDDVLAMIDHAVEGPVVLVGSSMGGWLMLLAARARPDRVVGMLGIAAALLVAEARPGDRIVVMGARDDTLSLLAATMVESLAG